MGKGKNKRGMSKRARKVQGQKAYKIKRELGKQRQRSSEAATKRASRSRSNIKPKDVPFTQLHCIENIVLINLAQREDRRKDITKRLSNMYGNRLYGTEPGKGPFTKREHAAFVLAHKNAMSPQLPPLDSPTDDVLMDKWKKVVVSGRDCEQVIEHARTHTQPSTRKPVILHVLPASTPSDAAEAGITMSTNVCGGKAPVAEAAAACALSHKRAVEHIVSHTLDQTLILEDDCLLVTPASISTRIPLPLNNLFVSIGHSKRVSNGRRLFIDDLFCLGPGSVTAQDEATYNESAAAYFVQSCRKATMLKAAWNARFKSRQTKEGTTKLMQRTDNYLFAQCEWNDGQQRLHGYATNEPVFEQDGDSQSSITNNLGTMF